MSGVAATGRRPGRRRRREPRHAPDGTPKVLGEFAYSSDLWADGMLWGTTLRSPHPYARIRVARLSRGARAFRACARS